MSRRLRQWPLRQPLFPSLAEQARASAEPILAAIADCPPDYEDDFNDPKSGWDTGPLQNEWEDEQMEVLR